MGLFSKSKPKIKVQTTKKDSFSGWIKCSQCSELIHENELENNLNCCPKCNYHYRLPASHRIKMLIEENSFVPLFENIDSIDPLHFIDQESYASRLTRAKEKSGSSEAVITGHGNLGPVRVSLGVLDFNFMGGSMGSVVGERICRLVEYSITEKIPLILVSASGGARMQESVYSLMQMAKTSAALGKLHEAGILYISVLTNPTTGGVAASFAALGDVILAEPNALVGFTGPRVIEQTLKKQLPEDAQKSECLLKHGMIDQVVNRHTLKQKILSILSFLKPFSD